MGTTRKRARIYLATEDGELVGRAHHGARRRKNDLRGSEPLIRCDAQETSAPAGNSQRSDMSVTAGGSALSSLDPPDEVGGRHCHAELSGGLHDGRVMLGRDDPGPLPGVDGAFRQPQLLGQLGWADAVDDFGVGQDVLHKRNHTKISHELSTNFPSGRAYEKIVLFPPMDTLPPQRRLQDLLREMRLETKLSLAKMARAAGFAAPNSYGHYESKKFKEAEIPIRHRQGIGDALFVRGISLERIRQLGPFTPSRAKAPQPAELNGRIDALTSEVAELRDAVQLLLKRTEQLERRRPKAG